MPSNSSKGTYYKYKTKKWLEAKGYFVEYIEKMQRVFANNKSFFVKRDLFASDILAMNGEHLVFIQVKMNRANIAAAVKEFHKLPFPKSKEIELWIVVWEPRDKEPDIIPVDIHSQGVLWGE